MKHVFESSYGREVYDLNGNCSWCYRCFDWIKLNEVDSECYPNEPCHVSPCHVVSYTPIKPEPSNE